jgi:diadenosine tetraphosphate (Ap4A) HIT family hydrolase
MDGCLACELLDGRQHLPGGRVAETAAWVVEHCVGPLGVGTLIVKPNRHVTHVAELTTAEAAELGPLLQRTAAVVSELLGPEQVYVTLWSHAGGTPGHIHWVVQPVTQEVMDAYEDYGPFLQVKMFERGVLPNPDAVEKFAASARTLFDD